MAKFANSNAACCHPKINPTTRAYDMKTKILVIDDEESLCEILRFNLEKEGYDVDTANSAEQALDMDLRLYQLFIVDIMMERLSGFDFAARVRNMPSVENTPIIFCSALVGEDDKVMGLNIGGDDYITKPFNLPEVRARVRAVLRRSAASQKLAYNMAQGNYEPDIAYRTLRIDRNTKQCVMDGAEVQLTRTEYDMLLFFLTHRDRIYSREEIIDKVWGGDVVISNRTIDTNITRLRKKTGRVRQQYSYASGLWLWL